MIKIHNYIVFQILQEMSHKVMWSTKNKLNSVFDKRQKSPLPAWELNLGLKRTSKHSVLKS